MVFLKRTLARSAINPIALFIKIALLGNVYEQTAEKFLAQENNPSVILLIVRGVNNAECAQPHLWKKYFQSVNIETHQNPRFHLRLTPALIDILLKRIAVTVVTVVTVEAQLKYVV